jgi:hypothetical protein
MLSSTRSKVDFVPNGVVVEQQKVVEESIVASFEYYCRGAAAG